MKIDELKNKREFLMKLIRNRAAIVFVAALGILVYPGSFPTCAQKAAGKLEKVRFADGAFLPSAPVYVALEKKYFKQEGLDISYLPFPTGREGLEAVINGKADFTTVADTPIIFQVMKGAKIYVLATLSSMGNLYAVVARRDRGISSARDLQGKKIGVALGTNAHFFLDNFLLFHNISRNGVRLLDIPTEKMVEALGKGEIEAVATWEPALSKLRTRLGPEALFFYGGPITIYQMTWNLAARQDFVQKNPETVKKVLKALLKAEGFINENRVEARRIITRYNSETDWWELDKLWKVYRSDISLNPLLIENLESQTRWAMRNQLIPKKKVPNYLQYIWFKGLESVKPEAVTIIH
jgi:ABC-type nitrate/sulfonate/bicarbonate transport system substrate-binding protein